jgi:hypothetical protein
MKKFILIIIVLALVLGGIWYYKKDKVTTPTTTTSTTTNYRNSNLGLSFTYPKILTASSTAQLVTLHHEVPFTHHDYCDFKGEGDTTVPTLTDFHVTFRTENKSLIDTMKLESPYIPEENFVNGKVVPSPGFIDSYKIGELDGFRIFEGAEGCGQTTYYFPISSSKTLIIKELLITVFTGAIDVENKAAAEAVPGVLNKEKAAENFESILQTLKAD